MQTNLALLGANDWLKKQLQYQATQQKRTAKFNG